jgi:hypothetical protein
MQFTLRDFAWGIFCACLVLFVLQHRNETVWQAGHDVGLLNGEANARNNGYDVYMDGYDYAQKEFLTTDGPMTDPSRPSTAVSFPVRVKGQKHWWIMRVEREADPQTETLPFSLRRPDEGGGAGDLALSKIPERGIYSNFHASTDSEVRGATHVADTREYKGETLYFWRNTDNMLGMPGASDWLVYPSESVDDAFERAKADRDRQNTLVPEVQHVPTD